MRRFACALFASTSRNDAWSKARRSTMGHVRAVYTFVVKECRWPTTDRGQKALLCDGWKIPVETWGAPLSTATFEDVRFGQCILDGRWRFGGFGGRRLEKRVVVPDRPSTVAHVDPFPRPAEASSILPRWEWGPVPNSSAGVVPREPGVRFFPFYQEEPG